MEADDTLTILALTANAWYDLYTGTAWTPYIGIGVGGTNLSVQLSEGTDDDDRYFDGNGWGFAYQAGVGVAFEVLSGFSLTAGYQFFGTLETEVRDDAGTSDERRRRLHRESYPHGSRHSARNAVPVLDPARAAQDEVLRRQRRLTAAGYYRQVLHRVETGRRGDHRRGAVDHDRCGGHVTRGTAWNGHFQVGRTRQCHRIE